MAAGCERHTAKEFVHVTSEMCNDAVPSVRHATKHLLLGLLTRSTCTRYDTLAFVAALPDSVVVVVRMVPLEKDSVMVVVVIGMIGAGRDASPSGGFV